MGSLTQGVFPSQWSIQFLHGTKKHEFGAVRTIPRKLLKTSVTNHVSPNAEHSGRQSSDTPSPLPLRRDVHFLHDTKSTLWTSLFIEDSLMHWLTLWTRKHVQKISQEYSRARTHLQLRLPYPRQLSEELRLYCLSPIFLCLPLWSPHYIHFYHCLWSCHRNNLAPPSTFQESFLCRWLFSSVLCAPMLALWSASLLFSLKTCFTKSSIFKSDWQSSFSTMRVMFFELSQFCFGISAPRNIGHWSIYTPHYCLHTTVQ